MVCRLDIERLCLFYSVGMIMVEGLKLETKECMNEDNLPGNLSKRLEELRKRERSYWEDELYSPEALTNLQYRSALERCFNLDPLGPIPPRQVDKSP